MEGVLGKFPEILKYGATGLSAILFFFAYLLLRQQSQRDRPDKSMLQTIRTYMYISVGLAVISLASTAMDGFTRKPGSEGQRREDPKEMTDQQKALDRLVANRIEAELVESGGKQVPGPSTAGQDASEVFLKRLRKAVFLNFLAFQASDEILKGGLNALARRGIPVTEVQAGKLMVEMPELRAARLRWLEDQAIPALQKDIDFLNVNPQEQRSASAMVPLPKLVRILPDAEATEAVQNMSVLREEVELLKSRM
jgi:hypothetical protein